MITVSIQTLLSSNLPVGATSISGESGFSGYSGESGFSGIDDDSGQDNITHVETLSGSNSLSNVDLWYRDSDNERKIYFRRLDGNDDLVKIQWVAKMFYSPEYYD